MKQQLLTKLKKRNNMINTINNNSMNNFKCKVDNRWMWGLENACITINSPRGGYVRVDKWHMDKLSDTQAELVWKCVKAEDNSNIVELTTDEMKELTVIGNIAGTVYIPYSEYKKKQSTLAQRKFISWKKSQYSGNSNKCGCGATLREKDHGTWVGYFCPKCKCGGSKNKNKKWR